MQQIAARMAAANDHRAVRCMMVLLVTLIAHTIAKWTIVPALVLALTTGQAFFVRTLLIAIVTYGVGGVWMALQVRRLQPLLDPYGLHLTIGRATRANDASDQ
jgi:hypothetical protein